MFVKKLLEKISISDSILTVSGKFRKYTKRTSLTITKVLERKKLCQEKSFLVFTMEEMFEELHKSEIVE